MALAFDTLGYAQRLREKGVPQEQAEAHASAARDFIMAELVTKTDLQATRDALNASIRALEVSIDNMGLRLTVRLGALMVVGIGALAALIKLT